MNRRLVLAILTLMCFAISAKAQWPVDSAKRTTFAEAKKYQDVILIIDGVPVEKRDAKAKLDSLSLQNVFDIIIITKQEFEKRGGFTPLSDAVVVTTKVAVKSQYQKTLSAL